MEVRGDVRGARSRSSGSLLERFEEFLPFTDIDHRLSLGEGATPLLRARHLEAILKIGSLSLKLEGQNPTGSFKDRGTVVGIGWSLARGIRKVGAVSTGTWAARWRHMQRGPGFSAPLSPARISQLKSLVQ